MTLDVPNLKNESLDEHHERLRAEAKEDFDDIPVQETKKKTQIIAIYGKGGIVKSFRLAILSCMMA